MEDEFIATIKLTTGEELIAKVSYMPDEDSLVLENPMNVVPIDQAKANMRINGFALNEWIHSTFDHMFILPKEHILTMTEVEDERLQNFYGNCVHQHMDAVATFRDTFEPKKFTRKMGSLGSIRDTKRALEDLYKRS
tara:strand:+ start:174 stop:584 length:411 start_codon:yes stop_codon:yes gene_type:complete